jgi:hypothetical protein
MPYVKQFISNKGEWLYDTTQLAIWSTVEVGVGITAASLPALRPVLQPILERVGWDMSTTYRDPSLGAIRTPRHVPAPPAIGPNIGLSTSGLTQHTEKRDSVNTKTTIKKHGVLGRVLASLNDEFVEEHIVRKTAINRVAEVSLTKESTHSSYTKQEDHSQAAKCCRYEIYTHDLV